MTKADWLRSEIEKLEGMKLDAKISRSLGQDRTVYGIERHNTALTSIITRYKEELKVLENVEQYKCKSYFDENNILQDCTCKRCT